MNSSRALKALALFSLCIAAALGIAEILPGAPLSQKAMTLGRTTSGYRLTGMVINNTNGKPIAGLTVKVFDESSASQPLATATSNTEGTYEFTIDRSLFPEALQPGELQNFIIRVFNDTGQVIKSSERHVEMTPLTDAHVDFRLRPTEISPENEVVCGYEGETVSNLILKLSGRELTEAFRSFSTTGEPGPQLNSDQQKLVEKLPGRYNPNSCAEGSLSALASYLDKKGESYRLPQLKQAMVAPLDQEFFTRHFHIRYTTKFPNGVNPQLPGSDFELKMPNGESLGYVRAAAKDLPGNKKVHPTQVQEVGLIAEHALTRFKEAPFSLKDPIGAASKLDILIQNYSAAGGTDVKADYIVINNRNSKYQNFGTVPHEIFHRVQYEYNRTSDRTGLYGVIREGGARFIEDSFNDDYNRYVFESRAIFLEPAHSLLTPPDSCSTPINYAAALFWKYLAEQNTQDTSCKWEPDIGIESYRQVLISTASGSLTPYDPLGLRNACPRMTRPASFDEFRYLDDARMELESSETTWGNYLIANYVHRDDSSPGGERRFAYLEDNDPVTWPFIYREPDETLVDVRKLAKLGAAIKPYNDLKMRTGGSVNRTVMGNLPYAATYYRITPDTSVPRMLRVVLSAFGGMDDPLIQILSFDRNGVLSDIVRSDQTSYSRTVNMTNLSSILVIVASRMSGGDYTLQLDEVEGGADPMITRWNSEKLTEYETDPRNGAWEFKSVDLTANDENLAAADNVAFGVDNKLNVRIHNRGNASIAGVRIELQYQPNRRRLDPALWEPVRDASHAIQTIKGLALDTASGQDAAKQVGVNWAPTSASSNGWCVKARIIAPDDLNNDNNVAIGCFGQSNGGSLKLTRR